MKKIRKVVLKVSLCFLGLMLILGGAVGAILVFYAQNILTIFIGIAFSLLCLSGGIILLHKGTKKDKRINVTTKTIFNVSKKPITDKEVSYPIKAKKNQTEKEPVQQEHNRPSADYIKTIFLHMFKKRPYKEDDSFPEYFYYEYGIINIPMYFNELKDEGLITLSHPEEVLGLMKVSELKDILSERGLKKNVKKSELIEYILLHINVNELPIMNENYFSLSQTGKEYIEIHHDYIVLKQHPEWGIYPWEYQSEKDKSNGTKDFNEIILSLLNSKILNIKKSDFKTSTFEYNQLQNLYISSYKLFFDGECFIDALKALFKNLLLSLSGCKNNYLIKSKKTLKLNDEQIMKSYSPLIVDSYVVKSICGLKDYYNENILLDVYKEFIGPYNLCTYEMLCEVTTLIFSSSILTLSKYDTIIRDSFIKRLHK